MLRHCVCVCVRTWGSFNGRRTRARSLRGRNWRVKGPERNTVRFMHLHINHWLDRLKKLGGYCEPANNRETSTLVSSVVSGCYG